MASWVGRWVHGCVARFARFLGLLLHSLCTLLCGLLGSWCGLLKSVRCLWFGGCGLLELWLWVAGIAEIGLLELWVAEIGLVVSWNCGSLCGLMDIGDIHK